jgi:hypothetical protein
MFLSAFFENFLYKKVNSLENRNFHSSVMFFISSITLLIFYLIFYKFNYLDFYFFYQWKFYLLTFLELLVFYLYRENYFQNKNNYTMINMFIFSTIYLMPILAFLYNHIFIFNKDLDLKYESFFEAFIFSFVLFVLSMIYYIDKIKSKQIKNIKLLLLLLIILLNTMYFSVKIIQTYNGFLVYCFIQMVISINFFILSKNESKKISIQRFALYLVWPFIYLFYFFAASLVAVEFIVIFKRVSQIIAAMLIDKKIVFKDAILIFLIILVSTLFYLYKV